MHGVGLVCGEEKGLMDWGLFTKLPKVPETLPPQFPRDMEHITTETGGWDTEEHDEAYPVPLLGG